MTGNRLVINIPSPQSLEPPPATVMMKNGHKVNTTGDQWQLFEVGTTYTLYFARFRDFCSPEFVNGLKWAYYKRLSKLSLDKAYADLGTFFIILKGFCEQKGVQINRLSSKYDIYLI